MSIFSWLNSLLQTMLHFLGLISRATNNPPIENGIPIFVRTNTGKKLFLHLRPEWKISDVKREIGAELGVDPESVRIIFAGKELSDDVEVADCDLGERSVLHAIQVFERSGIPHAAAPMNKTLLDLDEKLTRTGEETRIKANFFVFCGECGDLRPGKLRVRCSKCKEGSIVIVREPQNWPDVRNPEAIGGNCHCCGKETFAEFYFKCSESTSHRESPALNLIKENSRLVPCLSCGGGGDDESGLDCPVLVFDCEDKHVICLDCFRIYAKSRLNERRFVLKDDLGYTLPCPFECRDSSVVELRHFKLLGDRDYERYQRFGVEEVVLQSGGVLCPWPNCGTGIMPNDECEMPRKITCQNTECKYVFCRLCLQGFHIGECLQCDDDDQRDRPEDSAAAAGLRLSSEAAVRSRWGNRDDQASQMTIRISTKPCPKCRTPTERDGGCMHISCTKSACGFQWCWICQSEWTRECMSSHWFG